MRPQVAPTQVDHWQHHRTIPIVQLHGGVMHCLWLTLADPEPATNGQLIYSKGLIEALNRTGAFLRVVGLARPEHQRSPGDPRGIDWWLGHEERRPPMGRLLSSLPAVAQRGDSSNMKRLVGASLAERSWDAVVFDSICSGWALEAVVRHCRRRPHPPLVAYITHNHEVAVAQRIAGAARGLRRMLKEIDRLKVVRLERRLMAAADQVTANTLEDCSLLGADAGGRTVAFLPPGYGGPRIDRTIDQRVPRRAILAGSLNWPPKRVSLESFLYAGVTTLADAGIELQIVGEIEAGYLNDLRRRFPTVDFVGPVADVQPYLNNARLALVPDLLGGFKLKGLDYVFNRLPILAMRVALPGMPLEDGRSVGLFDSHAALAQGVVAAIDDLERLNAWQVRAYEACADHFDWDRIGRHLFRLLDQSHSALVKAGGAGQKYDEAWRSARPAAGR
jgi:glycosyltransferase involved in cell wall biosynthesis